MVLAMRGMPHESVVQQWDCGTLANLARMKEVTKEHIPDAIAAAGGIEAIVNAIQSTAERGVQEQGLFALSNLLTDNLNRRVQKAVWDANVIPIVAARLKAHPGETIVQERGCMVLGYLLRYSPQDGMKALVSQLCSSIVKVVPINR